MRVNIPVGSGRSCPIISTRPGWVLVDISTDPGKRLIQGFREEDIFMPLQDSYLVGLTTTVPTEQGFRTGTIIGVSSLIPERVQVRFDDNTTTWYTWDDEPDVDPSYSVEYGLASGEDWLETHRASKRASSEVVEPTEDMFVSQVIAERDALKRRIVELERQIETLSSGKLLLDLPARYGFNQGVLKIFFFDEAEGTGGQERTSVIVTDAQREGVGALTAMLMSGVPVDEIKRRGNQRAYERGRQVVSNG